MATQVTITLEDEDVRTLRDTADELGVSPSSVVRSAVALLRAGGRHGDAIRRGAQPIRRGGPRPGAGRPAGVGPTDRHVGNDEQGVTLRDLVDAGWLPAGTRVETVYQGRRLASEVLDNGRLKLRGKVYASLSSAGQAAKQLVAPDVHLGGTAGWGFWKVEKDGERISLLELRRRYVAATGTARDAGDAE